MTPITPDINPAPKGKNHGEAAMSEWQTIDSAPKDGTRVLVADARGHIEVGACGNTLRRKQEWRAEYQLGRVLYPQPLYWMPLPPPPPVRETP